MEDMYDKLNACSSSSSASMAQTDEISLFLHQILLRSSASASASPSVAAGLFGSSAAALENLGRPSGGEISAVDSAAAGFGVANACAPIAAIVTSSSPVGPGEAEYDEYDCESEEGLEALVEPAKTSIPRSSSKRSRAAEVHNLSEKRRRSRINEKMKALQNLIPNSNKTDKASMLDEAIEYLKQLQLQVQMLAMRNGLSLHPVSLPSGLQTSQLSQMRMDFGDEIRSLHPTLLSTFPMNQEAGATQNPFPPTSLCNSSTQQSAPNILNIINSDASNGLVPPAPPHLETYQFQTSAQDICREDGMRNLQKNAHQSGTSPLEFGMESVATLGSFHRQSSDLKCNDSLETCIGEGDWSESVLLKAIEQSLLLPPHLNSMRTGISAAKDDLKIERPNL